MGFRGITGISDFSKRVSRLNPSSGFDHDARWLEVGVITVLPIPMIDDDDIPARNVRVDGSPRHILNNVRADVEYGAVFRCQHLLAVGVVVRIGFSVALKTFAVR